METTEQIARRIAELSCTPITPSKQTIAELASILVRIELKKGECFLGADEVCKYIGYVQKGMIRQFYFKNKKDLTEHFASNYNPKNEKYNLQKRKVKKKRGVQSVALKSPLFCDQSIKSPLFCWKIHSK